MTRRIVRPELLDEMDPLHPDARRSRRDLQRVNRLMGNARWIDRALRREQASPASIAELGAGDGTFLLSLVERLSRRGLKLREAFTLDRLEIVERATEACFASLGCRLQANQGDILDQRVPWPQADLIVCNLFLHHFEEEQLRLILKRAFESCRWFVACEPRRWRVAPYTTPLLVLLGCNYVTRHDAKRSVEAGFWDGELPRLWPSDPKWTLRDEMAGPFSHLFMASRS